MADLTDYAENAVIDRLLRGQSTPAFPGTWHIALLTAVANKETGSVTEVAGGSYARQAVTANMTNWSGTQAAASTTASSGTGGRSSNNAAITFTGMPAATVTHFALYDASSGGNAWVIRALTDARTVGSGDSMTFAPDTLGLTVG